MIEKRLLKEILLEQKKRIEGTKKANYIPRESLNTIKDFINIKHTIIITGARRS
jgi:hypothetical protein